MNYDKSNYKNFKLKIEKKDTNSEGGVKFGKAKSNALHEKKEGRKTEVKEHYKKY